MKSDINHLSPEQIRVTQNCGTELPFSGELLYNKESGMYRCVVCGQDLFSSESKYDAGSGWPSFNKAVDDNKIKLVDDFTHFMHRTEVRCANCDAHLGHLFADGSQATGDYYCINSAALKFENAANSVAN